MLPSYTAVEIPLLQALIELGGTCKPKQVYPLVTKRFPQITAEDLSIRLKHGEISWHNRIQWSRQRLMESGDMTSPSRGTWAITEQGRKRVAADGSPANTSAKEAVAVSLVDLYERYESQFRERLLDRLFELTPTQFENFARLLLTHYGFIEVTVTQVSNDGGIDGHGLLKVGLARMAVAFQCKRWEGNIGRPEVDRFRGAIQGAFEQGIFFTTSDFTKQATEASIRKGAVPVILLNGESIVDLMIEKEFGVQRKPLQLYEDQLEGIFIDD